MTMAAPRDCGPFSGTGSRFHPVMVRAVILRRDLRLAR